MPLSSPRRLHPLGVLLSTARMVWGLWPAVVALLLQDSQWLLFALLVSAIPGALLLGALAWWRFTWWVKGSELRISRGIFIHKRVFIPRSRVQAVEIEAGLLQRLVGLVRVRIKTEASDTQAELWAVTRAEAEQLARFLQPDAPAERQDATSVQRWRLTPRALLLAATTSGRVGALLTLLSWIWVQFQEQVTPWLRGALKQLGGEATRLDSPGMIALLIGALVGASWLMSVVSEVVRFAAFHVERRGDNIVVARGLLERRETVIPRDRVQAVRVVEGLLRQPFGFAAFYIDASGHAGEKGQSTLLHPFVHRRHWAALLDDLLPALSDAPLDAPLESPPRRAWLRFFAMPVTLCAAITAAAMVVRPWAGGITAALTAPLLAMVWLAWRETGLHLSPRTAIVRARHWGRRETLIIPRRRAQAAASSASFLQRRRGLADCQIATAAGNGARVARARDLDAAQSQRLLQWLAAR